MIWHAVSWHSNCATPDVSRSCLPTLKLLFKTGLLASPTLAPLWFCAQALRALLVCPALGLSCFAVRLSTNPLLYLTPRAYFKDSKLSGRLSGHNRSCPDITQICPDISSPPLTMKYSKLQSETNSRHNLWRKKMEKNGKNINGHRQGRGRSFEDC